MAGNGGAMLPGGFVGVEGEQPRDKAESTNTMMRSHPQPFRQPPQPKGASTTLPFPQRGHRIERAWPLGCHV